jgi:soluble lytic murein transglycosylase
LPESFKKGLRFFFTLAVVLVVVIFILSSGLKLAYPLKYKEYVFKYSLQNNIDPYLVFAIIKAESGFKPEAISRKNARGLMQISEKTAMWGAESLGLENFAYETLFDPEINIMIGCWYIAILMKEFDNDIDLVITAYNGGSGNVNDWLRDKNYSDSGTKLDKIPFRETELFLKRVKNYYYVYSKLYRNRAK